MDVRQDPAPAVVQSPLKSSINDFSVSLFNRLSQLAGQKNVFASPFSVSTALSMLSLGTKGGSKDQIHSTLGVNSMSSESVGNMYSDIMQSFTNNSGVSIANYALLQKDSPDNNVLNTFKSAVNRYYGAKVDDVDFRANGEQIKNTINQWVNESTKGMIEKLLNEAPSSDTKFALLNAIHFHRRWKNPFLVYNTKIDTFYNHGEHAVLTDTMCQYTKWFTATTLTISGQEVQVLDLPYTGADGKISGSMIILLPKERNGLRTMMQAADFESSLKSAVTKALENQQQKHMNVFIPKFKFETSYDLKPALKQMGITDVFDSSSADLSGVAGSRDLYVSDAIHKAVIDVDEEGTKAAAVTGFFGMTMSGFVGPITDFKADHPFIFLIRDEKTGLILFMGKVEEF